MSSKKELKYRTKHTQRLKEIQIVFTINRSKYGSIEKGNELEIDLLVFRNIWDGINPNGTKKSGIHHFESISLSS